MDAPQLAQFFRIAVGALICLVILICTQATVLAVVESCGVIFSA